jgi:hypothetical protein
MHASSVFGDSIYVTAGYGSTTVTNCYRYIPASNKWYSTAGVPVARRFYGSSALGDSIYVTGGITGSVSVASCYRYIPASNKWYSISGLPAARSGHSSSAYGNSVYVIGGTESATARSTLYVSTPAVTSGGFLGSVPTSLDFNADRAQVMVYLSDQRRYYSASGTNYYVRPTYGTDWTMMVSANNGTNWHTISTLTPASMVNSTNFFGGVFTNATPGRRLRSAIVAGSNTVLYVRGVQRFAGEND